MDGSCRDLHPGASGQDGFDRYDPAVLQWGPLCEPPYDCSELTRLTSRQNYTVPLMLSDQYAGWGAKIGQSGVVYISEPMTR
jgi:hypothetical protein